MSYRILYDPELKEKYPPLKTKKSSSGWMTAVLLAALIFLASSVPAISAALKSWLLPGDPEVTEAALVSLADDLRAGTGFRESITSFCLEILDGPV